RGLRRPRQPRARAAPRGGAGPPHGRGNGPPRAQAGSARAENTPVMAALPLVLIVDDSARNRKLARDVLQLARFRTLEAATASEGIALASEHLPDVILMDLRLPDLDGTEAARMLRAQPRTSRIPLVALTALPVDARDDWLFDAGFAGYIVKPIDTDEFPDLVRGFCAFG